MCKHFPDNPVAIRAPCCKKWFDCAICHEESEDHPIILTSELTLICKNCRKAFRIEMDRMEEGDEFCPHCDCQFELPIGPSKAMVEEIQDVQARGAEVPHGEFSRYDWEEQDERIDSRDRLRDWTFLQ